MILFKKKKWKLKDYEENIDLIGSEMEDVHENRRCPLQWYSVFRR